jgi:hypothetical protein
VDHSVLIVNAFLGCVLLAVLNCSESGLSSTQFRVVWGLDPLGHIAFFECCGVANLHGIEGGGGSGIHRFDSCSGWLYLLQMLMVGNFGRIILVRVAE